MISANQWARDKLSSRSHDALATVVESQPEDIATVLKCHRGHP